MRRVFLRLGFLLLAGAAAAGWWGWQRLTTPYQGFSEPEVFVDLPPGSSLSSIGDRLVTAGVVPDTLTFRAAARVARVERRLQAGEYRFAAPQSPLAVVRRLSAGDVFTHTITFPEGRTLWEMAEIFGRSSLGSAEQFEAAARETSLIAHLDPEARSLEGYLFPDTYALARTAGAAGAVRAMVARFEAAFDPELRAAAQGTTLSLPEIVTLASLVEKETAAPEERPIVAAVYLNRLRIGMPLQADPTVIYAMILAGRWNGNITRQDLQIDSPYNTYRYRGLPPGPIASPGRAAIEATIRPAAVPYLYFVSRNDGTHVFASSLAEHNRNVAEWQVRYFRRPR